MNDDRETPDPQSEPPSSAPPEAAAAGAVPPEIAALPPEEFRRIWEATTLVVFRITRSKVRTDQLMSDLFEKLTTTRRWDPSRRSLESHMRGALSSMMTHEYHSKKPEREAAAHAGHYREERGHHDPSPEQRILDASEAEERRAAAARQLESLEKWAERDPVMKGVLRGKADGKKPAEIARDLGVAPHEVYKAIRALKEHMERMRAKQKDEDEP